MCLSAATAMLIGGGALAATKMLTPKAPKMDTTDPAAERAKAEAEAAQAANSKLATRNRARAASSLLAPVNTAGVAATAPGTKTTLGA